MNDTESIIDALISMSEEYKNRPESISNVKEIVNSTKPFLIDLKSILGNTNERYLKISTQIASFAQNNIIVEINKVQENYKINLEKDKIGTLTRIKSTLEFGLEATTLIESLDMETDFRINNFNENKNYLISLCATISANISAFRPISTPVKPSKKDKGCYIATMAYGDYEHPQVIILREFRDNILDKYLFGKWFIKTYYKYSPKLVEKLKNKNFSNYIIRKILNQFIKLIK